MNIVYRRVHLSRILTKLAHFLLLKRKFSYDPVTKSSTVDKSFLKFHSFQEARASSTISSETNKADKIILNSKYLRYYNVDKINKSHAS